MRINDSEMAVAFRQDLPAYNVPACNLTSFKKAFSPLAKAAKEGAKPGRCLICGEVMPKFCISHSVPKYCLKEIAAEGKLLTGAAIMGETLSTARSASGMLRLSSRFAENATLSTSSSTRRLRRF